jgi:hypothetical protein
MRDGNKSYTESMVGEDILAADCARRHNRLVAEDTSESLFEKKAKHMKLTKKEDIMAFLVKHGVSTVAVMKNYLLNLRDTDPPDKPHLRGMLKSLWDMNPNAA